MEIILANDFTNDPYPRRAVRLQEIQANIDELQPVLGLDPAVLFWAQNCHTNHMNKWIASTTEMGQKEGAFLELAQKDQALEFTYQDIKGVIVSRYANALRKLEEFKFEGRFPDGMKARIKRARDAYDNCELHRSLGYPEAIPEAMSIRLKDAADSVEAIYDVADHERFESEHATHDLNVLFDEDAIMLSQLHAWARAIWGRYDLRFELIGMVPAKSQSGGGGGEVPAAPTGFTFEWLEPVLQFSWDAVEGATSYQIAFSEDGGEVWEELYTGEEVGYEYEPPEGMRQYRVRARNADGYGEWSDVVEYEIEGAPPMSEWPAELTGLYANYSDFPSSIIIVGHDGQTGADSYRLKRVKVLITDPDPTNADMPAENFVEGLNEDPFADSDIAPDDKCAYWACGVDAANVEGEWTGPVVGEYPA